MSKEHKGDVTLGRVWFRENVITGVLAFFILVSLLVHAVTLLTLWRVRDVVRLQLTSAAQQVQEAHNQQVRYDFPIKQSFPFSTTVGISETLDVPIRESFPIKQTMNIPIDLNSIIPGAGSYNIPVPLDVTIPVSTTVKVVVRKQVPIATNINIDTVVPLSIDLKQPPLGDLLARIEQSLRDLLNKL